MFPFRCMRTSLDNNPAHNHIAIFEAGGMICPMDVPEK